MATVFTIKQHDTRPKLVATLLDNIGTPGQTATNLTTAKKVQFVMRQKGKTDSDGSPKVKATCELTDKPNGIVTYPWKAEDTDTVAEFDGEFEVEWEDGGIETIPNEGFITIKVTDDLG